MTEIPQETLDAVLSALEARAVLEYIGYRTDTIQEGDKAIRCFCPVHKEQVFRTLTVEKATKKAKCSYTPCPARKITNLVNLVAMVKEEAEVRLMRQATAIVDYAHEEVRRFLRPGVNEKQIAGVAEKACRDAGSEFAWTFTGGQEIASGYRTWTGACTPATDKIVQNNEFVLLDLHAMYGLMLGDVSHNAVMGKPDPAQKKLIEAYVKTCEHLVEVMQPGRTLGEAAKDTREFVVRNGWEFVERPGECGVV